MKNLLTSIQEMVGMRGDVWVVGAQNAGKSSLINAMQKLAGLKGTQQLTTAAHPGTTLGEAQHADLLKFYVALKYRVAEGSVKPKP